MPTTIIVDPVTRLEGHLKIQVTVDLVNGLQQVVDAKTTGTLFRGFEMILKNRDPRDAPDITQRICGVCPVSHGLAACATLEASANAAITPNARILRNLVLGANFIQSHILHFYHLALQDFVDGPAMPPWQPSWSADKRFSQSETDALVQNYVKALEMRRKAHEMGALFGGRLPHPPAFIPGGFTTTPRAARISKYQSYIAELISFIQSVYMRDAQTVATRYSDYYSVGRGYANLLAYGVFDLDMSGTNKLLARGLVQSAAVTPQSVNTGAITEQVTCSWYDNSTNNLAPSSGATTPAYPKTGGYSWLKAPRYSGAPYEVGPLARMWVNRDYQNGVSVMDRHVARAQEALKVAQAAQSWVSQLDTAGATYQTFTTPASGQGIGLTEAPRGALGHWVNISGGKIANYQIITPTCWNASPRDSQSARGPLEQALIGTPVANTDQPVEVMRVIHSFDPCLSCAVHVMRPAEGVKVFAVSHATGR